MKTKKIPMRTCIISRNTYPKKDLLRIVVNKNGDISIDKTGKMHGRGYYLRLNQENLKLSRKKRILEKTLKIDVLNAIYDELENMCNE
ncbi:MAG: RNase P modulator RnpM [Bacilli bacterium]